VAVAVAVAVVVVVVVVVVAAVILVVFVEFQCQSLHRHPLIQVDVGSQQQRLSFPQVPLAQPGQCQSPAALPLLEVHSYKSYHIEVARPRIVAVPIFPVPNSHRVVDLLLQLRVACLHQRNVPYRREERNPPGNRLIVSAIADTSNSTISPSSTDNNYAGTRLLSRARI